MALDIFRLAELGKNVLREHLSELNTHLVWESGQYTLHGDGGGNHTIGVDPPNDTLSEDLVFVKSNQRTERCGSEEREDDAVTGAIALKDFTLDKRFTRVGAYFRADLLLGFTKCECLWLCKVVGKQNAVVQRAPQRVVRRSGCKKVRRNKLRALMDELVE